MYWVFALALLTFVGIFSFIIQKRLPEKISLPVITVLMVTTSVLLINSSTALWIFAGGLIIGYVTDFFGVYAGNWYYHTKSGYNYWIGFAWAVVVLTLYHLMAAPALLAIILTAITIWILFTEKSKWSNSKIEWLFTIFKVLGIVIYPTMFVLSVTLGIFIEYLAVKVFKIWSYPRINYLIIGLGYGLIQTTVVYLAQIYTGYPVNKFVASYIALAAILYNIQYLLYFLKKQGKKLGYLELKIPF